MNNKLRKGWTTGACATVAAKAACLGLVTGVIPDRVTIALPSGLTPTFAIHHGFVVGDTATATVIKDAGDDPDITHGAEIVVTLAFAPVGQGVVFRAGEGVGTVTRPGLPLAVGAPAINPGPRAMILHNLEAIRISLPPNLFLTIGVTNGIDLARYTLNARLGIVGGLSILGMTGVVMPYSCSAWVASIYQEVDIARAVGLYHIAGTTGRASEEAIQRLYNLPESALIDMGDFVGALLKYLRRHSVPHLTLAGGFAKMAKLAQGAFDLHSGRSQLNLAHLAYLLARENGASPSCTALLTAANSAGQALAWAQEAGIDLAGPVARRARIVAAAVVGSAVCVDVILFDCNGTLLAIG